MTIRIHKSRSNMFDYVLTYDDRYEKGDYIEFVTTKDLTELYEKIKEELNIKQ